MNETICPCCGHDEIGEAVVGYEGERIRICIGCEATWRADERPRHDTAIGLAERVGGDGMSWDLVDAESAVLVYLVGPGDRPAFSAVADHLWGMGCDIDTDGDSGFPDDHAWTELSLRLRVLNPWQQVHIDPVSTAPLVLAIRSPGERLALQAAQFLQTRAGGELVTQWPRISADAGGAHPTNRQ